MEAKTAYLEALDAKCALCKAGTTMLCSGVRPYPVDYSQFLVMKPCEKLLNIKKTQDFTRLLEISGVPKMYLESVDTNTLHSVQLTDKEIILKGRGTMPRLARIPDVDTITSNSLYKLVTSAIYSGLKARFVYPKFVFRKHDFYKTNLEDDFTHDVDLVVVEYLDVTNLTQYQRSRLFGLVQSRLHHGLSTLVRVSSEPVAVDQSEVMLFSEIMDLPVLK